MQLNVDISPEQINQAVADAIIKSAIGDQLQKVIEEEVKKLAQNYNNPIGIVVNRYVHEAIEGIIREKYADRIKELVAEQVTKEFTEDLFSKMWNSFKNRY